MTERLYLDNAATSFPKPECVLGAMRTYAEKMGASAGRGAYREAVDAGELLADCRRRLSRLIGCKRPEQVVFTFNCTGALNQAIKGILRPGDHVVTTTMEHNSVLRPLRALASDGGRQGDEGRERIEVTHVRADGVNGFVKPADLQAALRPNTRMICLNHASNVTGTFQAIEQVGADARRRGVLLLVDAAQTVGHVPIDVEAMGIDLLAMPGHKGLLGPLGTGALYVRAGLEVEMQPLVEGGTGSVSERPTQPDFMPDKFESGSHNAIGLAGLGAALRWLEERTVEALFAHERALCEQFLEQTAGIEGLTAYGPRDSRQRVAVFSVRLAGYSPEELSGILEGEFGMLTRSGLHCAPLAHETIGTHVDGGTTRISFGAMNTTADVARCAEGLAGVAAS